MTVPDPDEQDGRDAARRDGPEHRPDRRHGPEDTDATFAAIVAEWRTEPDAPRWPADADQTPQYRAEDAPVAGPPPERRSAEREDDHFEPPEPPPFPVPQPRTIGGVLLLALGLLLLIAPGMLSLSATYGTPLGLLTVTVGIGWLVLGRRGGPPPEGWDDGARL